MPPDSAPLGGLFVTASGTGMGKTLVTAALAHQLRQAGRPVAALKPVITGYRPRWAADSDTGVLLDALGEAVSAAAVAACSPWRFAAPLSPDMAAAREGRAVALDSLVAFCRDALRPDRVLLVEGIGGVMVPLDARHTVLDWIAALGLPAVLVVGSYLGSLSHTLTAASALAARGVPLAGVVVSESEGGGVGLGETAASLSNFLAPAPVIEVARIAAGPRPWRRAPPLTALLPGQPDRGLAPNY